jgi:hypothetical protein
MLQHVEQQAHVFGLDAGFVLSTCHLIARHMTVITFSPGSHLCWVVPGFAKRTLPPTRITASPQSIPPLMKQAMIGVARTNHQVCVCIMGAIFINMMNLRLRWQQLTKRSLSYQSVLVNIAFRARPWMLRLVKPNVATAHVSTPTPGWRLGASLLNLADRHHFSFFFGPRLLSTFLPQAAEWHVGQTFGLGTLGAQVAPQRTHRTVGISIVMRITVISVQSRGI